LNDGLVSIMDGDREVVRVLPPESLDRIGARVPTSLSLHGNILTLSVKHRSRDFAYPVLADPVWQSHYDWRYGNSGPEGWLYDIQPDPSWYRWGYFNDPTVGGLWIQPTGGRVYQPNTSAKLMWFAPGSTKISRVDWHSVNHINASERQTMRLA